MKNAFDSKSSFTITYQKNQITVWPLIQNNKTIVVDIRGNIYCAWWIEPKDFPNTPHKRKNYHFQQKHKQWKKFENGLVSFQRGLLHALASGEKRILSFQEWSKIVKDANTKCFLLHETDKKLRNEIMNQLHQVSKAIQLASSKPLKEAKNQLIHAIIFEDSLGRFNVGVVQCRTVAVYERILETYHKSNIWTSDYTQRLKIVTKINDYFSKSLKRFKLSIIEDINSINSDNFDKSLLVKKIDLYINHFIKWVHIKPYNEWVKNTIDDLNAIKFRLQINDITDSKRLLRKIYAYTLFKELQTPIDEIIYELSYIELNDLVIDRYIALLTNIITSLSKEDVYEILGVDNVEKFGQLLGEIIYQLLNSPKRTLVKKELQKISNLF